MTPEDEPQDDSLPNLFLFLAFISMFVGVLTLDPAIGFSIAAVSLSIIGAGLKIASAIRHSGRRSPDRHGGV
ncbi:hypothetical protein GCM10027447_37980 [Glycomyces halotolerans]